MDTNDQLARLRERIGEPEDIEQARFTPTQLLGFLNEARRNVSRQTRCFQIKDSQLTIPGTKLYSVQNDFIGLYQLEWNGIPLRPVRASFWRDVVGMNDDLRGTPVVAMYFARQFQLFRVPEEAKTLLYRGWGYAQPLVLGGIDPSFTDDMADAAIWEAAVLAKGSDERDTSFAEARAAEAKGALAEMYRPKGPRYVNTGDLLIPVGGFLV